MRKTLRLLALASFLFTSLTLLAQDRFAFAITDLTREGSGWNVLRKLDLRTGRFSDILLDGTREDMKAFDARTKKQLQLLPDPRYGNMFNTAFGSGVAAAAFDRKHNRLYFTPMFVDQLRYIDLSTMKVYRVEGIPFTKLGNMQSDEGKIITRMVIAPNGDGYALSNDGNTFVRFSTGKQLRIESLGPLTDDPSNKGISIHNRCSSYGGDMISDEDGKLYILSARNEIFTVDPERKIATHTATIKNLPANFTTNGAVVNAEGDLLISSAVDGSSYFIVNTSGWSASPYYISEGAYKSSDLANGNFLPSKKAPAPAPPVAVKLKIIPGSVSLYPNPSKDGNLRVSFEQVPAGNYQLVVKDGLGRPVLQKFLQLNSESSNFPVQISTASAKGVYLVTIYDQNHQALYSQKLIVQ